MTYSRDSCQSCLLSNLRGRSNSSPILGAPVQDILLLGAAGRLETCQPVGLASLRDMDNAPAQADSNKSLLQGRIIQMTRLHAQLHAVLHGSGRPLSLHGHWPQALPIRLLRLWDYEATSTGQVSCQCCNLQPHLSFPPGLLSQFARQTIFAGVHPGQGWSRQALSCLLLLRPVILYKKITAKHASDTVHVSCLL